MSTDDLIASSKSQLDLVLSFFSRVDTKLSVLFAVTTAMLALLANNAPPLPRFTIPMIIVAVLSILLLGLGIFFLYKGAFPQLAGGGASLVYFREIAKRTEHRFIEEFIVQTPDQRIKDLLGQVWRNSEILSIKFDALKRAFICVAIAIVPWLITLALFASYHSSSGTGLLK